MQQNEQTDPWKKFTTIGEWVKNIPNLLHTLRTNQKEETLADARNELVFNFGEAFKRLDPAGNDGKLLGDLIAHVNHHLFQILVSDGSKQKGELLSEMIDLTNLITNGRSNETDWLTPVYRLLTLTYDHLNPLIETLNHQSDTKFVRGCCYLMGDIKIQSSNTCNIIFQTLLEIVAKYDDDQTRACAILALHLKNDRMVEDNIKLSALTTVEKFLARPDPSLTKLAAAIFIAQRRFNKAGEALAIALADYIKFQKYYSQVYSITDEFFGSTLPFKHQQPLSSIICQALPDLSPVMDWFTDRAIINLRHLDEAGDSTNSLINCCEFFFEAVLKDNMDNGMKKQDLAPFVVRSLEQIVKMDKIWNIEELKDRLSIYGASFATREALREFLADDKGGDRTYPAFEGLKNIDWAELQDAYGPATLVPRAIKKLVSTDPEVRNSGLTLIYSNVVHQGSLFSVSPHVVPFLMEILACPNNIDNARILILIKNMLYYNPSELLYQKNPYNINEIYPNPDGDEYDGYVHQVHANVKKDIDVIFNIILGEDSSCAVAAARILPLLNRAVDLGAVPVLKNAIEKHSDWSTKGELFWSLSFLYPQLALRDECLAYFTAQWKQFEANGALNFPICAALARFYLEEEAAPKFLVDTLLDIYSYESDAINVLGMLRSELAFNALLQKYKQTTVIRSGYMVNVLLDTVFKFELDTGKPIVGSALKPHQIELLQAIIDHPVNVADNFGQYIFTQRRLPPTMDGLKRLVEHANATKEIESEL